jgi:hypothetical protein
MKIIMDRNMFVPNWYIGILYRPAKSCWTGQCLFVISDLLINNKFVLYMVMTQYTKLYVHYYICILFIIVGTICVTITWQFIIFSGQMYLLRDRGYYFFICSPTIRCWYDLEERDMKLADIPMWDATRDFLLTDLAYRLVIHSILK